MGLFISACYAKNSNTPIFTQTKVVTTSAMPIQKTKVVPTSDVPIHTLSPYLQNQFFKLLQNNGNCNLPCFLGIKPGKTSWMETRQMLELYSASSPIQYDESRSTAMDKLYTTTIFTEVDEITSVQTVSYLNVHTHNDIVESIVFTSEIEGEGNPPVYNYNYLSGYSLKEVFQRTGIPDVIYFKVDKEIYYDIYVIYENLKIVMVLSGRAEQAVINQYQFCPNIGDNQVAGFRIAVANLSYLTDIKALIGYPFWENTPLLEEVSGMSIEDFYKLMINDNRPACFEVQK